MEELYKRADRYSMLEDNICATTQTVMIISQLVEGNTLVGKKLSRFKEGQSRDLKQSHDQSQKKKKKKKKLLQFTPLNISYERPLHIIRNLPEFKWHASIQMDPS